jgi:hypothetical protein
LTLQLSKKLEILLYDVGLIDKTNCLHERHTLQDDFNPDLEKNAKNVYHKLLDVLHCISTTEIQIFRIQHRLTGDS